MLKKPRLDLLLESGSLIQRAKRAAMSKAFGFYPAALHVMEPKTAMRGRSLFTALLQEAHRPSAEWTRPELELLSSFVSARNQCVF